MPETSQPTAPVIPPSFVGLPQIIRTHEAARICNLSASTLRKRSNLGKRPRCLRQAQRGGSQPVSWLREELVSWLLGEAVGDIAAAYTALEAERSDG